MKNTNTPLTRYQRTFAQKLTRSKRFLQLDTGAGYYIMWTDENKADRDEFESLKENTNLGFQFNQLQGCYNFRRTQKAWHKFMFAKRREVVIEMTSEKTDKKQS